MKTKYQENFIQEQLQIELPPPVLIKKEEQPESKREMVVINIYDEEEDY